MFYDLVKRCLAIDPRKRIRAADAVNHLFFTSIRGFRKPTEPLFKVPPSKQHRLDQVSVDELSLIASTLRSAAGGSTATAPAAPEPRSTPSRDTN